MPPSPLCARRFNTIITLLSLISLVHTSSSSSQTSQSSPSVCDPTEKAIERMIEGIRKLLNPQYGNMTPEEEATAVIKINPATQKHFELQIKMLQDTPRDPAKLRELLKVKERQYEKATLAEEIQSLVTEIEMLKFVQFLVNRNFTSSYLHGLPGRRAYEERMKEKEQKEKNYGAYD